MTRTATVPVSTGLTNGQSNTTTFAFDLGDRLSSVTTANGLTTLYSYNSRNLVATISKPSSQTITNTYDPALRLTQLADPFATTAYRYDNNGRLTETDDNAYGQSRKSVRVYDPLGRLVQTVYPNSTQEIRSYDLSGKLTRIQDLDPSANAIYSYVAQLDPTGRIIGENVTPAPATFSIPDATMTFDADNRLSNFNGQSVAFDADGNMTQGPSAMTLNAIAYSYDARNRLASAGNVTYSYNPDGRRIALTDATTNPNGVSSSFVVDPSARLDRMLVRNKGGNTAYYVYGLGLIGQEQSGSYQNYHFDSRGSTVAMTDANGNVTDRFEYDSYANSLSHTGTSDTPFQYNGRFGVQTDSNGLLYMRARYYNPAIRRFINQDVLFGNINQEISLNRFAYANGNPISSPIQWPPNRGFAGTSSRATLVPGTTVDRFGYSGGTFVSPEETRKSREMLAVALGNMRNPAAVDVLIELLEDDEVAGHALMGLAKLKARKARPYIERFLNHPKAWVRKEASKALAELNK